jgi:hypothetical protein
VKDAVTEVLFRHELGDFTPKVRARLDEIFAADPPDAMERLEKAAEYLGVHGLTRATLERVDALIAERGAAEEAALDSPSRSAVPRQPRDGGTSSVPR